MTNKTNNAARTETAPSTPVPVGSPAWSELVSACKTIDLNGPSVAKVATVMALAASWLAEGEASAPPAPDPLAEVETALRDAWPEGLLPVSPDAVKAVAAMAKIDVGGDATELARRLAAPPAVDTPPAKVGGSAPIETAEPSDMACIRHGWPVGVKVSCKAVKRVAERLGLKVTQKRGNEIAKLLKSTDAPKDDAPPPMPPEPTDEEEIMTLVEWAMSLGDRRILVWANTAQVGEIQGKGEGRLAALFAACKAAGVDAPPASLVPVAGKTWTNKKGQSAASTADGKRYVKGETKALAYVALCAGQAA